MLNKEKVRLMTKLARYEQKEEKRYLKISKYYRSDYIGIALLKNFFCVHNCLYPYSDTGLFVSDGSIYAQSE